MLSSNDTAVIEEKTMRPRFVTLDLVRRTSSKFLRVDRCG
jgi:hypothetical protein